MWDGAGGQLCRERGWRVKRTGLPALPFPLAAVCVVLENGAAGLDAFLQFPGRNGISGRGFCS